MPYIGTRVVQSGFIHRKWWAMHRDRGHPRSGGTRAHREIAEIARGVLVGSRNSKAEKKIKLEEAVKLEQNKN